MKLNNRTYPIALSMLLTASFLMSGCGDSLLDSIDINQEIVSGGTTVAETEDQAAGMFLAAQELVHDIREHKYQAQFNLHIDNYCGYMCLPQNFDNRQPSTYAIFKDFNDGPRQSFFWLSEQALPVMRGASKLDLNEIGAMAQILYCYSAHEIADTYGPFPWTDYKNEKQEPPLTYTPVKDIYDSIFVDLKKSVEILRNFESTPADHQERILRILSEKDQLCGAKINNWIKFANSLRLRLAMHISKVDPARAQKEAEEAVNPLGGGVLEASDKDIAYDETKLGKIHPLAFIAKYWSDTRLNASFENMLKRLHHPMLGKLFAMNETMIKDKEGKVVLEAGKAIVGIRSGVSTSPRDASNQYINFSTLTSAYDLRPVALMKVSEVLFLQTEGALRGWSMNGRTSSLYKNAIQRSFQDEGLSSEFDTYYARTEADQTIDYIDYHDPRNNLKGLVTVGVAWPSKAPVGDTRDIKEIQLEYIITQKYIANFPMSLEAWTDLRRTGYPQIFPLVFTAGDFTLEDGQLIRRMPWIPTDDSERDDINGSAVPALGGPNFQATRIWWDVNAPNF